MGKGVKIFLFFLDFGVRYVRFWLKFSMLDAGFYMLDTRFSMLDTPPKGFSLRYEILDHVGNGLRHRNDRMG